MRSLASLNPDITSFLGILSAVPGTVGLPAQQKYDPRGNVHLPVIWARGRRLTCALSAVQRAAVSAHDHQRAAGKKKK